MALIISLLITIISYGAGPVIYMFTRKKPVSFSSHKWFCIIYTVVIAIIYLALTFFSGESVGNLAPAIIWGIVFFYVSKNYLTKKGLRYRDSVMTKIANAEREGKPLSPEEIEKINTIAYYDEKK